MCVCGILSRRMKLHNLQNVSKRHSGIVVLTSANINVSLDPSELEQTIQEPQVEFIPPPANLTTISSLRDQVGVEIHRKRLQIVDHSESLPCRDGFSRMAAAVVYLVRASGAVVTAYGFNYDIEFTLPSEAEAAAAIANRFINTDAIRRLAGIETVGGAVRFFYYRDHRRCFLYLEPRRNKLGTREFFAHVNVHSDLDNEDAFASDAVLDTAFRTEYEHFAVVVDGLFGNLE